MLPRRQRWPQSYLLLGLALVLLSVTALAVYRNSHLKTTTVPPPLGACYSDISGQCQRTVTGSCPPPGARASRGGYCEAWLNEQCPRPDACQAKVVSATATATGACGDRQKLVDQCITEAHNKTAKLCVIRVQAGPNCGAIKKGACAKSEPPADQTPAPSPSSACSIECTVISLCVATPSLSPSQSPI